MSVTPLTPAEAAILHRLGEDLSAYAPPGPEAAVLLRRLAQRKLVQYGEKTPAALLPAGLVALAAFRRCPAQPLHPVLLPAGYFDGAERAALAHTYRALMAGDLAAVDPDRLALLPALMAKIQYLSNLPVVIARDEP